MEEAKTIEPICTAVFANCSRLVHDCEENVMDIMEVFLSTCRQINCSFLGRKSLFMGSSFKKSSLCF